MKSALPQELPSFILNAQYSAHLDRVRELDCLFPHLRFSLTEKVAIICELWDNPQAFYAFFSAPKEKRTVNAFEHFAEERLLPRAQRIQRFEIKPKETQFSQPHAVAI